MEFMSPGDLVLVQAFRRRRPRRSPRTYSLSLDGPDVIRFETDVVGIVLSADTKSYDPHNNRSTWKTQLVSIMTSSGHCIYVMRSELYSDFDNKKIKKVIDRVESLKNY